MQRAGTEVHDSVRCFRAADLLQGGEGTRIPDTAAQAAWFSARCRFLILIRSLILVQSLKGRECPRGVSLAIASVEFFGLRMASVG